MPNLSWFFAPEYVVAACIWFAVLAIFFIRTKTTWERLNFACHLLLVPVLWYLMAAAQLKSTAQVLNLGSIGWSIYGGAVLVSTGMVFRIWSKVFAKRKTPH